MSFHLKCISKTAHLGKSDKRKKLKAALKAFKDVINCHLKPENSFVVHNNMELFNYIYTE